MRPTPEARTASSAAASGGWVQNHVIVGGWSDALPAPERIAVIQNAITTTAGLADQALRHFAPRRSTIVKIQFASETAARQGHFRIQKQFQGLTAQRPDLATLWASPERPPQIAFRRRVPMNATDALTAMLGPAAATVVRPDLPAGTICFNKLPVLEINADAYPDITAFWATCPALAGHTWRRVSTVRKD